MSENEDKQKKKNQKDKIEHPKKDILAELAKFQDREIRIKFINGRQGELSCLRQSEIYILTNSHRCSQRLRPAHEPCP